MTTANADVLTSPDVEDVASEKRRGPMIGLLVGIVIVVGVIGAAAATGVFSRAPEPDRASAFTTVAKRGPLVISVVETGTIKAASQTIIKSEVEGQATVLEIVPEGQRVKKGDLLVALDVSKKEDELVTAEIKVRNDESDLIQAQEDYAVKENQAAANVSAAELDYRFAVEDRKKFVEGDFPKDLKEAENKITIAEEELRRSADRRAGSERLHKAGIISLSELEADRLSQRKNELNLDLARQAYELLEGWTYRRKIDEFDSDIEQKKMALERAKRKARADMAQAEARVAAREAELRREKLRLENLQRQVEVSKIYAPTDGMVVYATSGQGGWRGNQEPLEAGQSVRERQELIYLPEDMDRIAQISIDESVLDRVSVGMKARVTLDAAPGRVFWGTVEKIAPLPDASVSFFNPDKKVYPTQIRIKGIHEGLRTGMNCRAEVVIATYDEVVYVPVQSVVRVGGVTSVFVVEDGQIRQREVELGLDDNENVIITSGLEEGEVVSLNPPLNDTGVEDSVSLDDLPADALRDGPTTQPAEEEVDPADLEPVTVSDFSELRDVLGERMNAKELARYQEMIANQEWQKLRGFSQAMMTRYKVTLEGQGRPGGSGESPSTRPSTRPTVEAATDE
jgi:HlyD family secretion protein